MATDNNLFQSGLFSKKRIYKQNAWKCVETRGFTVDEAAAIERAEVVAGKFGLSVCFYIKNTDGDHFYIDADDYSNFMIGDVLDPNKLVLKKLINEHDPKLPAETLRVDEWKPTPEEPKKDSHPTDFNNPFNLGK